MALVTFKGWEGKWWKNIKPGRAVVDAALTVLPGSGIISGVAKNVGQRVGSKLIRGGAKKIGRWFRGGGHASGVRPGAHIGSKVTSGALKLGNKQAFRAGGTAFNIRNAAKLGTAGVAAVGVGKVIGIGKPVGPSAAVSNATGATSPRLAPRIQPAASSSSSPAGAPRTSSTSSTKRCGCPAGQRMLCFKRKHNPEAVAKRRARSKAAREKSKAKTAKRTAKTKAATARRKATRAARGVRRAIRGKR